MKVNNMRADMNEAPSSNPLGMENKASQAEAELLTVDDLARLWKLPKSWVYERTRRRGREQLPHVKLGKYLRFEEWAVRQYLERQRHH
jgi:hypothetical protein